MLFRSDVVVNVQGDLPTLEPKLVAASVTPLSRPEIDIATVVAKITVPEELTDNAVVKAAMSLNPGETVGPTLYFSRNLIPSGPGDHYHHIGERDHDPQCVASDEGRGSDRHQPSGHGDFGLNDLLHRQGRADLQQSSDDWFD